MQSACYHQAVASRILSAGNVCVFKDMVASEPNLRTSGVSDGTRAQFHLESSVLVLLGLCR